MSQGVREANRRADKLEGALREARRRADAMQHALLSTGPLTRLLRLYDDLDGAADPMHGRQIEGGSAPHPFDRPMPHLSTKDARELQRVVDRNLFRVCDVIADWLNTTDERRGVSRGVCPGCGGPVDRSGRPPTRRVLARQFLEQNLLAGAVREDHVRAAAVTVGIARDTLKRAAQELQVHRFEEAGAWWWQLSEV